MCDYMEENAGGGGARSDCIARPSMGIIEHEEAMNMFSKGNQKIDCRVCSCEYHSEDDVCDLDCICVQPMTGATQQDAASQTLCGSYKCSHKK